MRDKMVILTCMVLTIMLSGAKAVPVEITQHLHGIEEKPRPAAFNVYFTSEYVNVETGKPMKFDGKVTNIGDFYNFSTGVFTAPTSGTYIFSLKIKSGKKDEYVLAGVKADDKIVCTARAEKGDVGVCFRNVHLNKGGIVFAQQISGSTYVYGLKVTMFSGTMLFADQQHTLFVTAPTTRSAIPSSE